MIFTARFLFNKLCRSFKKKKKSDEFVLVGGKWNQNSTRLWNNAQAIWHHVKSKFCTYYDKRARMKHRPGQKWSIVAISGLELLNPCFPIQNHLHGLVGDDLFSTVDLFPHRHNIASISLLYCFFHGKRFRWAPFSTSTSSDLHS